MEKSFRLWVSAIALIWILAACQPRGEATPPRGDTSTPRPASGPKQWNTPPEMSIDASKSYSATISTTMGDISVSLFAQEAPQTVNNFAFLAREDFYNDVKFHRIIKDFMIQTGDPKGDGTGGPGYRFADEPVVRNYERGTLAMANAGPNTNGSQFFIVHGGAVNLPKNYTIFGIVAGGMDVVDSIATSPVSLNPRGEASVPQRDIRIKTVSVKEG